MADAAIVSSQFLSIVAVLTTCWVAARRQRYWTESMQRLMDLLPEVRAGRVPMDELAAVKSRFAPMAQQFRELIQEVRQQRTAVATLEAELRQRVASRTDALERTIGSLRNQANRDPLTGLNNRRLLDEHLPQAMARCRDAQLNLSLLMIDVDHFKQLNDTRGHAAGDELLRSIGQIIRSTLRDNDVAFRYGGDEFVVVMEGSEAPAAHALAERLTSLVDALSRTLRVTPVPRLSIGVATTKELSDPTPQSLCEQADKKLYQVKNARRDCRSAPAARTPTLAVIQG